MNQQLMAQRINTHRILVIEDDVDLNELYSQVIRRAGYRVYQATTLQTAQELLSQYHFDVLLCDIRLNDGYGTRLLAEYQTTFNQHGTQVIMVSAEPQYQDECERLGVEFFLVKPVALKALVQLVSRLLSPSNIKRLE